MTFSPIQLLSNLPFGTTLAGFLARVCVRLETGWIKKFLKERHLCSPPEQSLDTDAGKPVLHNNRIPGWLFQLAR
jgi:hypothetical protein